MKKTSKILLMLLVFALVAALFVACVDDAACQHEYVDGKCTKCGAAEPTGDTTCEHNFVNGVCSKCNTACKHKFENDVCTICKMADANAPHELIWAGLDEITIPVGDDYNVLTGVTVRDRKHGDLTAEIKVLTEEDEEELTALGVYEDFEAFNHNVASEYTVYYKVTCKEDAKLSEIKSKTIAVTKQHNVANGDFALVNKSGFNNWNVDFPGAPGATMEQYEEDGQILPKFNFPKSTGNAWWTAQFINSVNLVGGKTYRVAITAKSNTGKSVAFGFEDIDNDYAMLTYNTAFVLDKEYKTYYSFITPDKDYVNAKAVLYLGYILDTDEVGANSPHDAIIKRINIEQVDVCPEVQFDGLNNVTLKSGIDTDSFDPMEGVTATQAGADLTSRVQVAGDLPAIVLERTNYTLCYYIPNENGKIAVATRTVSVYIEKEHGYDILNGEFTEGAFGDRYWTQDVNAQNPGEMEVRKVDDGLEITIVNKASAGWHIQLRQDITLTKDTIYEFEVRAKASVNRNISLEINGGTGLCEMALTQEYKVFEYTYSATSTGNQRLGFLLGGGDVSNNGSVITIDYIRIKLSADQTKYEAYELKNSQFKNGAKLWGNEGNTVEAAKDGERDCVNVTITNHDDNLDAAWKSQFRQDGLVFETGKTYKLKAVVKSSVEGTIKVEVTKGGVAQRQWTLEENKETVCEFEFTVDANVDGVRVGALLANLPVDAVLTFYSFEITLVETTPAE